MAWCHRSKIEANRRNKMAASIVVLRITGISPLLQNNPASMGRNESMGMKKIPSPEDEAKQKAYQNADGTYYILSEAFRSAIIGKGGGASGRKIGKRSAISACCAGIFTTE